MDSLAAIKVTFFQECEEQLGELESGLLAMENGDRDPETVNAVFRAVHSIKGGAGAFSLEPLVRFAHVFETTLDDVRANRLVADSNVIKVMLRAADILADHVRAARDETGIDEDRSAVLASELAALGGKTVTVPETEIEGLDFKPVQFDPMPDFQPIAFAMEPEVETGGTVWTVNRIGLSGAAMIGRDFRVQGDVGVNQNSNRFNIPGEELTAFEGRARITWVPRWRIRFD